MKTKVAPFYLGHSVESRQHSTLNDANSTYTYKPTARVPANKYH